MPAFKLTQTFSVLSFVLILQGCASTFLNEKQLAHHEDRKNVKLTEANKEERFAAGFIGRYGLDPDDRQDFLKVISEDDEFIRQSFDPIMLNLEGIVADKLYREFSGDIAQAAVRQGLSVDASIAGSAIAAYFVADLLFSESGKDIVGGINLPGNVNGEFLETESDANNFVARYINEKIDAVLLKHDLKIHKTFESFRPAASGVPPIHFDTYWLVPKSEGVIDTPKDDHLFLQVARMEVLKTNPEAVSPTLVASLGFIPEYSIPSKYFRGLSISFLENVAVDGDIFTNSYHKEYTTELKRDIRKMLVGSEGYLFSGDFRAGYARGKYLSFKDKNYTYKYKTEREWMKSIIEE